VETVGKALKEQTDTVDLEVAAGGASRERSSNSFDCGRLSDAGRK
jgi:hypothetical protein